jgi:hypothetical protein
MAVLQGYEIEFFGGPMDGETDVFVFPPAPFFGVISLPMGKLGGLVAAILVRLRGGRPAETERIAVYELTDNGGGGLCYQYLGTQIVPRNSMDGGGGPFTVVRREIEPAQ